VARENGEGKTGTFEAPFVIPDLDNQKTLRVSSVVLSNQREPVAEQVAGVKSSKKLAVANPLVEDGKKLLPNVTRVFRPGQSVLVYVEVYDPTIPEFLPERFRRANVAASLALYQGGKKAFETPAIRANQLSQTRGGTLPIWLQAAAADIRPGKYDVQINLIDEFGSKFAFPRTSLAVLAADAAKKP
jgi:hypothetical protein